MIHRDNRGSVAIVRMEHGKANAIDAELVAELDGVLDELEESSTRSIVLTGTGLIFSAGVDLFRVLEGGREYLAAFLPALVAAVERLFMFPKPVVAAINGHAIAGGCILACACDHRVMTDRRGKIGVPELLMGVPYPMLVLEMLRFVVPNPHIQEVVYSGGTYSPAEALDRGLIDEVAAADAVLDRACDVADKLGAISPVAFQITKQQLRRPALDRSRQYEPEFARKVMDAWESPATEAAIREYLRKTIGRSS
jgi:enoyl-CoA hydratase